LVWASDRWTEMTKRMESSVFFMNCGFPIDDEGTSILVLQSE
jgi:hypothetical protein